MKLIEFKTESKITKENLSDSLEYLKHFGNVWLSYHPGGKPGWHASIKLFVPSEATEFTVKTGFQCATPENAIDQLFIKLSEVIKCFINGNQN